MSTYRNYVAMSVANTPGLDAITLGTALAAPDRSLFDAYGSGTWTVDIEHYNAAGVALGCEFDAVYNGGNPGTITRGTPETPGTLLSLAAGGSIRVVTTAHMANRLDALLTSPTGSGANVLATSPTLVTPNLGTPSAVTLTNGTGLPATGIAGGTAAGRALLTAVDAEAQRAAIGLGSVENKSFATGVGDATAAAASKTTLVDADSLPISDSATGGALKRVTVANLKASVSGAGNLAQVAAPDAATTMAVNTRYVGNLSAFTANRTYTLPATAAVGNTVQIYVSAGSATRRLLITANSGQTLNGVTGGTEWSRLYRSGEFLEIVCTATNTEWAVSQNERIPAACSLTLASLQQTGIAGSTDTKILFDTISGDTSGGAIAAVASSQFVVPRAGIYTVIGVGQFTNNAVSAIGAVSQCQLVIFLNGSRNAAAEAPSQSGSYTGPTVAKTFVCATGDTLSLYAYQTSGGLGGLYNPILSIVETL